MNESLFNLLYSVANKNVALDAIITFFAAWLIFILLAIFVVSIALDKNRMRRYYFAALSSLSVILTIGIVVPFVRQFYPNPRPFDFIEGIKTLISHPSSSSIPSGHMMFTVPLALAMFYFNRKMGLWFIGGAFLMGVARIIAGVHWPFDILAGMLGGVLCFYFVKWMLSLGGFDHSSHKGN